MWKGHHRPQSGQGIKWSAKHTCGCRRLYITIGQCHSTWDSRIPKLDCSLPGSDTQHDINASKENTTDTVNAIQMVRLKPEHAWSMSYSKCDAPHWVQLLRYLWTSSEMTYELSVHWFNVSFRVNVESLICWTDIHGAPVTHQALGNKGGGGTKSDLIKSCVQAPGWDAETVSIQSAPLIHMRVGPMGWSTDTNPVCRAGAVRIPGRPRLSGNVSMSRSWAKGRGWQHSRQKEVLAKAQMGVTAGYGECQELHAVWSCRSLNRRVRNGNYAS